MMRSPGRVMSENTVELYFNVNSLQQHIEMSGTIHHTVSLLDELVAYRPRSNIAVILCT
jgi:hypothetical protein